MRFAGETACATTGKSFACIGGACFSLPRPLAGASFLSFSGAVSRGRLTVLGGHGHAKRFPWGKPWHRQPVSGKLRRKLGVSPGFAAYRGPPSPKPLSTRFTMGW
jgi:hypothetical protein